MKIKFALVSAVLVMLSACATVQPLSPNTMVLDMPARDTVLVVTEEFNHKGNILPAGKYYPALQVANGYVIYHFSRPIKVRSLWYNDVCRGGITVKQTDPYNNYYISVRNCFADPNIRIDIPHKVKFKIESVKSA